MRWLYSVRLRARVLRPGSFVWVSRALHLIFNVLGRLSASFFSLLYHTGTYRVKAQYIYMWQVLFLDPAENSCKTRQNHPCAVCASGTPKT